MTPPSSNDSDTAGLYRDAGSGDVPVASSLLRFKDFKHLTLRNAKDPTTFLVWWFQFKAEVINKLGSLISGRRTPLAVLNPCECHVDTHASHSG
jgi:hypothetical protein